MFFFHFYCFRSKKKSLLPKCCYRDANHDVLLSPLRLTYTHITHQTVYPVTPVCSPGCGKHANCSGSTSPGVSNKCACNDGYSGNPYKSCSPVPKCEVVECGTNAVCLEGATSIECICPAGYQGNPYLGCDGQYTFSLTSTSSRFLCGGKQQTKRRKENERTIIQQVINRRSASAFCLLFALGFKMESS